MKIAFVSDAIYPYNKGGKEKRLFDITTRLAGMGHEIHIYCMKWWDGPEKDRIENGIHLHAISPLYGLYTGERRSISQGILFGIACLKLLFEDWDVIDVDHMPFFPVIFTKIVCILKRKKMIATWHEVWGREYWVKYMGLKGNIAYILERLSALLPNTIISISNLTTKKLSDNLKRKKNVITIPCGVNLEEIKKTPASKIKSDIIFAGRLLAHKNVDLLIQAVAILKKKREIIKCIINGNGPEKQSLIKLSQKLNVSDSVTFSDFLADHSNLMGLMKSSRIFVLTSEREGFGIVGIEAYACGLKLLSLNHPDNAISYFKNDLNIGLFEKDPTVLARLIDDELHGSYNSHIRTDILKKFDLNDIVSNLTKIYSS